MQPPPVTLCFTSFGDELKALKILKIEQVRNGEVAVEGCNVRQCRFTGTDKTCYEVTPKVPGGKIGLLKYIVKLVPLFPGLFIVFDKTIVPDDFVRANVQQHQEKIKIVTSIDQLNGLLGIVLEPHQVMQLTKLFIDERRRVADIPVLGRGVNDNEQAAHAYSDRFIEAMMEGRRIGPPDQGDFVQGNGDDVFIMHELHDDVMIPMNNNRNLRELLQIRTIRRRPRHVDDELEQEDDDFLRAQEESLRMYQQEHGIQDAIDIGGAEQPPRIRRKINADWENILKEPEVSVNGVTCVACKEHRPSICFLPCGHQSMCDRCTREMFSLPGVNRSCPVCRALVEEIIRPYVA